MNIITRYRTAAAVLMFALALTSLAYQQQNREFARQAKEWASVHRASIDNQNAIGSFRDALQKERHQADLERARAAWYQRDAARLRAQLSKQGVIVPAGERAP